MDLLAGLLTFVLVALVVVLVSAPLRARAARAADHASTDGRADADDRDAPQPSFERDELEAAREAKYREIRDSELDFRTGKLSRADYDTIDAQLRAEALQILDRLERARERALRTRAP